MNKHIIILIVYLYLFLVVSSILFSLTNIPSNYMDFTRFIKVISYIFFTPLAGFLCWRLIKVIHQILSLTTRF
jgi:hypothetical protein